MSLKTQAPKIPDGSRNSTLGVSFRSQKNVHGPQITVLLYPGFMSFGAMIVNNSLVEPAAPEWTTIDGANKSSVARRPLGTAGIDDGLLQGDTTVDPFAIANPPKDLEAWRMVSCGMKVRTINSDEQNDGFYRAVRVKQCHGVGNIVKEGGHVPVMDVLPPYATWPNDPSFSSGRIKDLIRKDFILATENHLHPWVEWYHTLTSSAVSEPNRNRNTAWTDSSFDMIILDIHGGDHTHILIDFYANYEFNYRADAQVAQFMTTTHQVYPATLSSVQQRKRMRTIKAAS